MTHTIDILLATYNGEKYLREQLESILSQSYQNFHLLIRDDGSSDNTLSVINTFINQFPSKISLVEDSEHLGVHKCFSKLLSLSKAPYVMFADQDDVWLKDKVLMTFQKMNELEIQFGKNKPLLVHGDLIVVDKNLKEIAPSFWSYTKLKPREGSYLNRLIVQNEVTGCTLMMNHSLRDKVYPIPSESIMHDWWIALVATAFGYIGVVQEPLILYRQHDKNALGAIEFKPIKKLGAIFKNHSNVEKRTNLQAKYLLKRYDNMLSQKNLILIRDFVSMSRNSFLRNRYLLIKCGFFKHGILRNIYRFILKNNL